MSVEHTRLAWRLDLPTPTKIVVLALADHACELCGLCWPGILLLQEKTALGATRIREALEALRKSGEIEVRSYPKGGRGRATEYVVFQHRMELSPAPCGKCAERLKNPPRREGFDKTRTNKPTATRGVSGKPTGNTPLNPPDFSAENRPKPATQVVAVEGQYPPPGGENCGEQPSVQPEPPRARAREEEPAKTPPARSSPEAPADNPTPPPRNAAEALAAVERMVGPSPRLNPRKQS